jgi:hypothetical protein
MARRCGSRKSPPRSTASRTTASPAGTSTSVPSSWRSSASPAPIPSKRSMPSSACCRVVPVQAAGSDRDEGAFRPQHLDPRIHRRRPVHADAGRFPGDSGHPAVPAQPVGHVIPALALPISVVGTFGAMYAPRLQPRQPVAAGADAECRLRRRRRHRHAGKHRPPRREGRNTVRGGDQGRARNRLHDRLDDRLAGRRVHSGAVHERHRRPPAARIRGHHLRRHPGLRPRLADPDADALQPLPEARRAGCAWPRFPVFERFFACPAAGYERSLQAGDGAPAHWCWSAFFATLLLSGYLFTVHIPRISCRAATAARSSPSPKARRTSPSPRW